ncbi:MAG: hypothetical protein KBT03_10305 [Bacteroidales bacterium]|nr:hypothetical protein [Candidatus Scybalousia scybalohippi]
MSGVKDAKVVSNSFLKAGIHDVIFKSIDKSETMNAIELRFEAVDGSGIHIERIWEPRSAERTQSQFGANPSEQEQFMCKIKQVIDALDPALSKRLETDGDKFQAPDFDSFVKLLKKYLDKSVGTQTQIKLVPTNGNYVGFPTFIASLTKEGVLYMKTRVIGEGLTLNAKEATAIENAKNAKPTAMKPTNDGELDDLKADFNDVNDDEDVADDFAKMPF